MFRISFAVLIALSQLHIACKLSFIFICLIVVPLQLFGISIFVVVIVFSVVHGSDSSDSEIEALTEQLFRDSDPNLFPYVTVRLQGSTSSYSRSDDADAP